MCDVLHALYEDDVTPIWERHHFAKSKVRVAIYNNLYGRVYRFPVNDPDERSTSANGSLDMPQQMGDLPPEEQPVKPYIPPTNPDDLGSILDGPMGG